jgi:hypothetical protein
LLERHHYIRSRRREVGTESFVPMASRERLGLLAQRHQTSATRLEDARTISMAESRLRSKRGEALF